MKPLWMSLGLALWAVNVLAGLENMQAPEPAPPSCPVPDANAPIGAQRGGGAKPTAVDLGCAIGVEAAAKLQPTADALFVDTRLAREHDAYRIDGAMNLSFGEIKAKPYLRERALVLLGSGKSDRQLYATCADLKRDGFKHVRVLRGGMQAWLAAGRPTLGQAPGMMELLTLTPAELYQEAAFDRNVLLVSADIKAAEYELRKGAVFSELTPRAVKAAVREARKGKEGAVPASIIIVAGDRQNRSQLHELVGALRPDPVLVYIQPMSSYAEFLRQQKAMWVAQARGPKLPGCSQ